MKFPSSECISIEISYLNRIFWNIFVRRRKNLTSISEVSTDLVYSGL